MANLETQQEFRDSLDEDIFEEIGKEVVRITATETYFNERGERQETVDFTETIVAVPYSIVNSRQSHISFGEVLDGDMDMVLRFDQEIEINDRIEIDSDTFWVKEVAKNYLPDNVATIVRLTKIEPVSPDEL